MAERERNHSLIYFAVAMGVEAAPIIKAFQLKRVEDVAKASVYVNEEDGVGLFLTGTGELQAACVTAAVIARRDDCSFLIQAGIAGIEREKKNLKTGEPDTGEDEALRVFLIHKIKSASTGRDYYPDMTVQVDLPEAQLITETAVWRADSQQEGSRKKSDSQQEKDGINPDSQQEKTGTNRVSSIPTLHDMEAAGVYQAAGRFLTADRILTIKVVSDEGKETERIGKEVVQSCMDRILPELRKLVMKLGAIEKEDEERARREESLDLIVQRIAQNLHLSVTMTHELRQLIRYWQPKEEELEEILAKRTTSKRDAKRILEELRARVLSPE